MSQVIDYDVYKKNSIDFILGGKEFKISFIPFDLSIRIYELIPAIAKLESGEKVSDEELGLLLGIMTDFLRLQDDTLTVEWTRKEMNFPIFSELIKDITQHMFATKKNNVEEDSPDST